MWSQIDDDELMQKVANGDPSAFKELFDRHSQKVLGYACRLLGGDMSRAEDISQNTWIKIVNAAPSYQGKGQFIAWMHTVIRNTTFNEIRKTSRFSQELDENEMANIPDKADIEAEFQKRNDIEEVKQAIDKLPDNQRLALVTWLTEDVSYDDIARELNCSVSSVKSLLFRARKQLQDSLGGAL